MTSRFQIITPDDVAEDGTLKPGAGVLLDSDDDDESSLLDKKGKKTSQLKQRKGQHNKEDARIAADFVRHNKTLVEQVPRGSGLGSAERRALQEERRRDATSRGVEQVNETDETPHLFISILLSLALTAIFIAFDYLVFLQFHMENDYELTTRITRRYAPASLCVLVLVYPLSRYVNRNIVQAGLLAAACVVGCRVIAIAGDHSTFGDMLKVPGLVVVWIYCVIQMRFAPAFINVLVVLLYHHRDFFKGGASRGIRDIDMF